jgi:hypothetical protein
MDIQKILAELREQRDQVAAVIEALEKIAYQQAPRRGRPPKWLTVEHTNGSENGTNGLANGSRAVATPRKPASGVAAANGSSQD